MAPLNVFITGISGSVGHYLFDLLANDPRYRLYLLLRDKTKLKRDLSKYQNLVLIEDNLRTVHRQKEILKQMDYVVLIATSWGGFRDPWKVNVYATLRILRKLDPSRIKKIIYFSTASILDREHRPVEAIREIGTNYIRSKFLMHKMLPKNKLYSKIVTLFPTWVYGGDELHPYSHAATGLKSLKKYIWLVKFFKLDFSFHFIHCADIAKIVKYMLENEVPQNEYVLGNAALTVGDLTAQTAEYFGQKVYFQISIPMKLLEFLARFQRKHTWDEYCLKYRHFIYRTANADTFGLPDGINTVAKLLKSFGL